MLWSAWLLLHINKQQDGAFYRASQVLYIFLSLFIKNFFSLSLFIKNSNLVLH
jgi:hypothetical protein